MPIFMQTRVQSLAQNLTQVVNANNEIVDESRVLEIIIELESISVTTDDLKITRLGRSINELRRKTSNIEIGRRAKELLKAWRGFVNSNIDSNDKKLPTVDSTPAKFEHPSSGSSNSCIPKFEIVPRNTQSAVDFKEDVLSGAADLYSATEQTAQVDPPIRLRIKCSLPKAPDIGTSHHDVTSQNGICKRLCPPVEAGYSDKSVDTHKQCRGSKRGGRQSARGGKAGNRGVSMAAAGSLVKKRGATKMSKTISKTSNGLNNDFNDQYYEPIPKLRLVPNGKTGMWTSQFAPSEPPRPLFTSTASVTLDQTERDIEMQPMPEKRPKIAVEPMNAERPSASVPATRPKIGMDTMEILARLNVNQTTIDRAYKVTMQDVLRQQQKEEMGSDTSMSPPACKGGRRRRKSTTTSTTLSQSDSDLGQELSASDGPFSNRRDARLALEAFEDPRVGMRFPGEQSVNIENKGFDSLTLESNCDDVYENAVNSERSEKCEFNSNINVVEPETPRNCLFPDS